MADGSGKLAAQVAAIPYWYHRIELPGGVTTPGWAPINPLAYKVEEDLTGLRVLDVGAWDGYWTFHALERGAREVVAIEDFSDDLGLNVARDEKWKTFDLCREAFGYDEKRVQRRELSVYDISPETVGMFDVVFFFGTLYHLRHPLLALDKLSAVCRRSIYIETAIIDDFTPYRPKEKPYGAGHMVMEFYPGSELGGNTSNWWAPTTHCLANLVLAAGFNSVDVWKLTEQPKNPSDCRGFARGFK